MQGSYIKSALLLSFLGLASAQSSCPAPVTVTVTVGGPSSTSSAPTSTSSAPACATAASVPGYTTEWSCQNAAADGAGYLNYYVTDTLDPVTCASYCASNSACSFFNVYQELESNGATSNICVLWSQDKPLSSATNSYNQGHPISNSAGYIRNVSASSSITAAASTSTASAPATSTIATSTSATVITPSVTDTPVSGYTLEWSQQTAAANCAGYLTSNVADTWNVQACADQCTGNAQCAFFNVYQQQVGSNFNYVCVLWSMDQPLSCATNTYNNGQPITASGGYLKQVPVVSSSTASVVATTSRIATTSTSVATSSSSSSSSRATSTSSAAGATTTSSRPATTSSAALPTSTTLSTSTRSSTTTTSSASICPNGTPVPTQCSGQNQFIVGTTLNGVETFLGFNPNVNSGQTYLTNRAGATIYYYDASIGRLRTCPCALVPYYRYPPGDAVGTNNFFFTLSSVATGSSLGVIDAVTKQVLTWKAFDNNANLGVSSDPTATTEGQGPALKLTITKVTV